MGGTVSIFGGGTYPNVGEMQISEEIYTITRSSRKRMQPGIGFTSYVDKKRIKIYYDPLFIMKTAYFVILALLLLCVRADDADKVGFKCPVGSKFLKERINAKKFERLCLSTLSYL